MSGPSIGVIGAGIIGLSCALELRRRGANVTVYQSSNPRPTSLAAAGMLGPAFELSVHKSPHPQFAQLCVLSAQIWPEFAAQLAQDSGQDVRPDTIGTLACPSDQMSAQDLTRLSDTCRQIGLECQRLNHKEARAREPALARRDTQTLAALYLPADTRIDPSIVMTALHTALQKHDVPIQTIEPVSQIESGPKNQWRLAGHAAHNVLLLAMGAATRTPLQIDGQRTRLIPEGAMFPVKGEILALAPIAGAPRHIVRSGATYIVPSRDAILIGATSYPGIEDTHVDRSALKALQHAASQLCPILAKTHPRSQWAGIRPGSSDHAPFLGATALPGLYCAAGHYRNGILLAPASAQIMAEIILQMTPSALGARFALDRPTPPKT